MKYLGSISDNNDLVTKKYVDDADSTKVPTSRTVNSKALSSDITLSASDVSAVPTTRKVNNKALSTDITLSASDVSAMPTVGGRLKGFSTRQTSANLSPDGSGGVTTLLATSVMTTGRPGEGTIFHCYWDNTSGWDHQLFVADDDTGNGRPFVAVRGMRSGNWTAWDKLLSEASVGDWVVANETATTTGLATSWTVRKWHSGYCEAFAVTGSTGFPMNQQYTNGYYYATTQNLPTGLFTSVTYGQVDRCGGTSASGLITASLYNLETTRVQWYAFDTRSETVDCSFAIRIVGKWK